MKDRLSAVEVAKELGGISVSAVHRLASRKRKSDGKITLPATWLNGKRVWKREVITAYLADKTAQDRRRAFNASRGVSEQGSKPKNATAGNVAQMAGVS